MSQSYEVASRARLETVLRGELPDQVPVSFWLHNFAREQTVDALVGETLRLQRNFGFDFVKPQSPMHAASLLWGAEVSNPAQADEWPKLTRSILCCSSDLHLIGYRSVSGQLADQIEVIRQVKAAVGPDVPVIGTIFAPLMVMWMMHRDGKPGLLEMVHEAPVNLTLALDAIAATLCEFAGALIDDAGVDGIFYATTTCCKGELTDAEHARHHAPYDRAILAACGKAAFNILHLCGHEIEAARFTECEAPIVSWELGDRNPGLSQMRALFGRTLLTGVAGKPLFGTLPIEALQAQTRAAIVETGGRNLIMAPGCSINPGVDEERIRLIVDEVRASPLSPTGLG